MTYLFSALLRLLFSVLLLLSLPLFFHSFIWSVSVSLCLCLCVVSAALSACVCVYERASIRSRLFFIVYILLLLAVSVLLLLFLFFFFSLARLLIPICTFNGVHFPLTNLDTPLVCTRKISSSRKKKKINKSIP